MADPIVLSETSSYSLADFFASFLIAAPVECSLQQTYSQIPANLAGTIAGSRRQKMRSARNFNFLPAASKSLVYGHVNTIKHADRVLQGHGGMGAAAPGSGRYQG